MSKCPHCFRRFRSKAAERLAERRRAVILDLQGVRPAQHLRPVVAPPDLDRRSRHLHDSAEFRAGR
jgi:hypothetical protein